MSKEQPVEINITLREGDIAVAVKPTGAVVVVVGKNQTRQGDFAAARRMVTELTKGTPGAQAPVDALLTHAEKVWRAAQLPVTSPALPPLRSTGSVVRKT